VKLKANKQDNQELKVWEGKAEGAWDLRMSCTRAGGGTRKSNRGRPFGFDLQGAGYVIRWLQLPPAYCTVKSDESGCTEASSRPVHLRRNTPTHSGVHTLALEKTTNSTRVAVL
jgi:hypothetical protein